MKETSQEKTVEAEAGSAESLFFSQKEQKANQGEEYVRSVLGRRARAETDSTTLATGQEEGRGREVTDEMGGNPLRSNRS